MRKISGAAPAAAIAFAESYSQFVPGNTGISTFGSAVLIAGAFRVPSNLYSAAGISVLSVSILHVYTVSSLPS